MFYMNLVSKSRFLIVFTRKMSSLLTPSGVRGMKSLDRDKFTRKIRVPVLKISEEKLGKIIQTCRPYFLKLEDFKPVQNLESESDASFNKCIYFNPEKITQWNDITKEDRDKLSQNGVGENNFYMDEIQVCYENLKYETIFKAVLPEHKEIVSGFSQIGHIIHLNLREHLLDYKSIIGAVLVDKIKTCRTVINKKNIIDNTYRNFLMEVIAGEEDFFVTVKENSCNFQFDFSKVYWNPRLGKEHERILSFLKPSDVLFDVFCGVGPFSVPAAKRKCIVFANDLNPESFKWLNHNAKSNKVKKYLFNSFNLDGKDFICNIFKNYLEDLCKGKEKIEANAKIHVTMNLPAMAVEFLKHFRGLLQDELAEKFNCEIIVYFYCFAIGNDRVSVAKSMVNENIGCDITSDILDVFNVRNVSHNKEMMRVTFRLTKCILMKVNEKCDCEEPPVKKQCVLTDK